MVQILAPKKEAPGQGVKPKKAATRRSEGRPRPPKAPKRQAARRPAAGGGGGEGRERGMRKPKKKLKLKTKRGRGQALQADRHRQGEARPVDEAPHPDQEGAGPEAGLRKSDAGLATPTRRSVRRMLLALAGRTRGRSGAGSYDGAVVALPGLRRRLKARRAGRSWPRLRRDVVDAESQTREQAPGAAQEAPGPGQGLLPQQEQALPGRARRRSTARATSPTSAGAARSATSAGSGSSASTPPPAPTTCPTASSSRA